MIFHVNRISRSLTGLALLCLLFSTAMPLAATEVDFFARTKIVNNPHSALPGSQAIDCLYVYSVDDAKHYMAFNFGCRFPFLTVRADNMLLFEAGGFGGLFTRFELFSESFNFIDADFLGGGYVTFKYRLVSLETSVYHISSHVGDDYIRYEGGVVRNAGYEAVRQYLNLSGASYLDLSLGYEYKFGRRENAGIFNVMSVLLGWRLDFLSYGVPLFLEAEGEIVDLRRLPNVGVRIGCYLDYLITAVMRKRDFAGRPQHELSFRYYYGYSKMVSFYRMRENLLMVGGTFRY